MIDVNTENGECELKVRGTIYALYADTLTIIKEVYKGIKKKDITAAEIYKHSILNTIETAFMTNEELDKCLKDLINEICNKINKHNEDDLIQELKDLKKAEME